MTEDITLRQKLDTSVSEIAETGNTPNSLYNFATHNPFADEQNTMSDFFDGGDRIEQLDEAIHLCQFGNNIALITGDAGTGKTFFLEQACLELSETAACCFINGSMDLSSEDIAKEVSTELSMPFATSQTIEQLIDMLDDADALQDVSRFIIIVDDIHLLSEDIILSLLQLSQLSNNVFHLLASGLPSTLNYLESFEFQEGLIKEIYLYPYSRGETHNYLNFKMKAAGYKGENFFDLDTVSKLYRQSAGYPSKINTVAEQYLLSQDQDFADEDDKQRGPGLPLWHMIGLVFLLFALILAFFYSGSDESKNEDQTIPITLENDSTTTLTPNEVGDPASLAATTIAVEKSQALNNPDNNQGNDLEQISTELANNSSINNDKSIDKIAEAGVNADNPAEPEPTETTVLPSSNAEATAPAKAGDNAGIEQNSPNPTPADTSNSPAVIAQATPETNYSVDEQAVLSWPENDSTIQVIGALDKASLEQYVAAQANKASLRLVTILRGDQPWHIVLADHYPDNNQARQAIQRLPQNQVNAGPWIRRVSDLKQGIRAFPR